MILALIAVAWLALQLPVAVVIGKSIRHADDRLAATLEPARNAPAGKWAA